MCMCEEMCTFELGVGFGSSGGGGFCGCDDKIAVVGFFPGAPLVFHGTAFCRQLDHLNLQVWSIRFLLGG